MRSRPRLFVALAATILLGLATRSGHRLVPDWLATNAGDALWTVAVYWTVLLVRPGTRPGTALAVSLAVSLTVELTQLYSPPWLQDLRRTPARLLLGTGWQWLDLPRYLAGAVIAWALDRASFLPRHPVEPTQPGTCP